MSSRLYSKRHKAETKRNRKKRQKTFKSIESAKHWAQESGIKEYKIKKMTYATSEKKLIIVPE